MNDRELTSLSLSTVVLEHPPLSVTLALILVDLKGYRHSSCIRTLDAFNLFFGLIARQQSTS